MLKDIAKWVIFYPVRYMVWGLPRGVVFWVGLWLGGVLAGRAGGKREAFLRELRDIRNLPEGTDAEREVQRAMTGLVLNEIEMILYPRLGHDNILDYTHVEGMDNLRDVLKLGRGAMLLFAHYGNNQMIMPAIGYRGYRMSQISASPLVWMEKLPNKRFSAMDRRALQIRHDHEQSLPVEHINVFGSLKAAFKCLKGNNVLGIAIDGGGGDERVAVDFLGRRALFSTGAIKLAMKTGCAVLPTVMLRDEDGTSRMIVESPLELDHGLPELDRVRDNTMRYIERFEPYVLKYPGNYLNFLALRSFMTNEGDTPYFIEEGTDESAVQVRKGLSRR